MNSNNNVYNSQQQQQHRSVGYLPDEYQLHLVQRQHRRSVDVTMDSTTKNNNNNNTKHDGFVQQQHHQPVEKWNVQVSGLDNSNNKLYSTKVDVSTVTSIPIKQQLQQEQQNRTTSESTFVDYNYNTSDDDNDEYFKNDFSSDSGSNDFCVQLDDDDDDDILVDYSSSTNFSSNENVVPSNCIPALSLGVCTAVNPAVVTEHQRPKDDENDTAVHDHLEQQQQQDQQQNQPTDPEGSYHSICSATDDDKESIIGLRVVSVGSTSNPTSPVSNFVPYSTSFQMSLPISSDTDAATTTTTTEGRTTAGNISSLAANTPTKYDSSTTTSTSTSRISEMRKRRKEQEQFLVDRFARTKRLLDNKDKNTINTNNYASSDDEEELILTPPFTPPPSIKNAVSQQHKLRSDSQHSPETKSESIHNMLDKVSSVADININNTLAAKERLDYLEHTLEVERTKRIQAEMKLSEMMENEQTIKKGSIRSSRQRTLSSSGSVRSMNSSNSNKSNKKNKLLYTDNGPKSITDGNNNNNNNNNNSSAGTLDSNDLVQDERKGSDIGTGNNIEQPVQLPVWVRRQISSLQNTITIKDLSIESLTSELVTKDTEIHACRQIIEDLKLSTSTLPSNSTSINNSSNHSANSANNNNNNSTDLTDSQHIATAESIGSEHSFIQLNAAKKHILMLQNDVRNRNRELKRCDVTIADYEQQVHTLRNNLHESFQNQRNTERKVCTLMEQFEVDDIIDISEKFDKLTALNEETSTKLEQTTKEIQQVHMETLSILHDSKSYVSERETEHEATRVTHEKIVAEFQTLLESTTKERDTIQHQIDCVSNQCNVASIDEIPTKVIDLQVRCAQLEDATNDSKQIKQALDFLIDRVDTIQKLCNVDNIDELTVVCQTIVDERALLNSTKVELEQVRSDLVDSQKQIRILKEKNDPQKDDIDDNDDNRIGKQIHRQISRTVSTASTDQTTVANESSFASVGVLSLDSTVSAAGCPGGDDKEDNENELELHRQLSASRKNELHALDRIRVLEDDINQREWKIAALEDQLQVLASKGDRSAELEHMVESLHKRISTANDEQLEFETRISMIQNICELNNVPDIPSALAELRDNFTAARSRLTSSKDVQEFLTVGEELKQYANEALSKQLHDIQKELTRTKRELKRAKKNSDGKDETTISLDSISEFSYIGDAVSMGSSEHNDPITVLQMELSRAETKSRLLQSEVNSLRKQLSFAENQVEELGKNRCTRSRSADDISVDGLTGINLEFIDVDHAQSEDGNDVMFDVQRLQQVNQLKQREIDNLRNELDELAAQLTVARNAIEELEHERSYNQAKLSEMSSLVSSNFKTDTDQLLKDKSLECAELSFENETLKKSLNTSDSKLIVLQKDIEQKNYLIQQLSKFGKKDDGLSLDDFIVCLQEEHEISLGRVAEISVQLAQSQSKVDELKDQICKLHKQIDVLSPSATTQSIKAAESMIRRNIARARSNSYLFAIDMSCCEDDDEYLATAAITEEADTGRVTNIMCMDNYGTDDEDEQRIGNSQFLVRNETTISPTGRSSPRRRKVTSRSKSFFM